MINGHRRPHAHSTRRSYGEVSHADFAAEPPRRHDRRHADHHPRHPGHPLLRRRRSRVSQLGIPGDLTPRHTVSGGFSICKFVDRKYYIDTINKRSPSTACTSILRRRYYHGTTLHRTDHAELRHRGQRVQHRHQDHRDEPDWEGLTT